MWGIACAAAFSAFAESGRISPRWSLADGGTRIVWNVREDKRLPHWDKLEMSGLQSSLVLVYTIDANRKLMIKRIVLWPQYRTQPNNTHGTCYHEFEDKYDSALAFELDGKIAEEVGDEISFDGIWSSVSRVGDAVLVRRILPCADKPAAIETVEIRNAGSQPLEVKPLNGGFRAYCIGCDARFEQRCDVAEGVRTLKAGERATMDGGLFNSPDDGGCGDRRRGN